MIPCAAPSTSNYERDALGVGPRLPENLCKFPKAMHPWKW